MPLNTYTRILHSARLFQETMICTDISKKFISTTCQLSKKTPQTIGVMSWVRAARRREHLETFMKKYPKSKHNIMKEEMLKRTEPKIEFLSSSRIGKQMNEEAMFSHIIKPTVFLSKDKETVICYHPPPQEHPYKFTKPVTNYRHRDVVPSDVFEPFEDSLTKEQKTECQMLRDKDAYLWNSVALGLLFKVKPSVIKENMKLTEEQTLVKKCGKKVFIGLSAGKKRKQLDAQNWERINYVRQTRDRKFTKWYEKTLTRPEERGRDTYPRKL